MLDFLIELSHWYNLLFVLPVLTIVAYQLLHTLAGLQIDSLDAAFGDLGAMAAEHLPDVRPTSRLSRFVALLNVGGVPPLMIDDSTQWA